MLFGQSLFQSVLERLQEERESAAPPEETTHRIRGFSTGFVAAPAERAAGNGRSVEQSYLDTVADIETRCDASQADIEPPPVAPPHLSRLTIDEIAADLALSPDDTAPILNEKRRAFARLNHPDGIAEPFRINANARMTIANLMIDEALRRLAP